MRAESSLAMPRAANRGHGLYWGYMSGLIASRTNDSKMEADVRILSISAQKPDSTGSGIYLAQTVAAMARAGHKTAVIAGIDAADKARLPEGALFYPVRYNTPELPFNVCGMSDTMPYPSTRYRDMTPQMVDAYYAAYERALRRAVEEFCPDLIVCHHLYLVTSLVARLMPGCPVVAICHNTDLRQMKTHDLERPRVIQGVRMLDRVLALHEDQAKEIARIYGVDRAKITVVGTGYDDRVFHDGDSAGAGEGKPTRSSQARLCYVGKIAYKKGVMSLLRCLPHVGGITGAELRLVGGSGSDEEMEQARQLASAVPCAIEFTGRLDPAHVADVYRASDVFVLPSFYEGLPLVVIEALACGCRIVLSDLPGIKPWLQAQLPQAPITYVSPPRMVDVDEPDVEDLPRFEADLAKALGEELARARRAGKAHVDTAHLTWDAVAARIVAATI